MRDQRLLNFPSARGKASIPYNKKAQVVKNIQVIRCYLNMDKTTFALKSQVGNRATEFEKGRFRPTMEEIEKIAAMVQIKPEQLINNQLQLTIKIN